MVKSQIELIEESLEFVANKGWVVHGDEFLNSLCKFLGDLFGVDYTIIDKYDEKKPNIATTVAIYSKNGFLPNMEYELANTPCNNVIGCKLCSYPQNVQSHFPEDELLVQMNVNSYIAIPLWSSNGKPIGLIALMDENPLVDLQTLKIILQIVAIKAAHELEKMLYENQLQIQVQELLASEEEIRASNEELHATTDALKESNEELLVAKEKAEESDRLKTEFINNLSHEIRTPMNGIIGFSAFLKDLELTPSKRNNYINIIESCGKQLLGTIDDILEISRLGTQKVPVNETSFCLNDLLWELYLVFKIKAEEKNIPLHLKRDISDNQSLIISDDVKINKIVSNLLENALKFTENGYIELGCRIESNTVDIYVKDTGVGIRPQNQKNIFDRFSQEEKELSQKFGGLGLGLSIAQKNAELIGGEITLDSQKGKGSTFNLKIPHKIATQDTFKDSNECNNYTVVIAEDDEVNFLFLEILIKEKIKLPCKIIRALNGKEVIRICNDNNDIKLVLMDIKMPIINGFDATRKIKKMNKNIIVIAQTAYSTKVDIEKALDAGCDSFVSKPIDENKLKETLSKLNVIQ